MNASINNSRCKDMQGSIGPLCNKRSKDSQNLRIQNNLILDCRHWWIHYPRKTAITSALGGVYEPKVFCIASTGGPGFRFFPKRNDLYQQSGAGAGADRDHSRRQTSHWTSC